MSKAPYSQFPPAGILQNISLLLFFGKKNRHAKQIILMTLIVGLVVALCSTDAIAMLTSDGKLDYIGGQLASRLKSWRDKIYDAATWMFWTLGAISLTWTLGVLALRKADLREFFAEFIRFILFFGFFLWLLTSGHTLVGDDIYESFVRLAKSEPNPTELVDVAFKVWGLGAQTMGTPQGAMQKHMSSCMPKCMFGRVDAIAKGLPIENCFAKCFGGSPVDKFLTGAPGGPFTSIIVMFLAACCFLFVVGVALNMALIYVSQWFLLYAGIFLLGFGGSRWTSDIAINYYKAVLGLAMQFLCMVVIVDAGKELISSSAQEIIDASDANVNTLAILLFISFAFFMLSYKVPAMVASIITGGAKFGSFSRWTTTDSMLSATTMLGSSVASVANSMTELRTATSTTNENIQTRSEVLSSMLGVDSDNTPTVKTTYAEAAGWHGGGPVGQAPYGGAGAFAAALTNNKVENSTFDKVTKETASVDTEEDDGANSTDNTAASDDTSGKATAADREQASSFATKNFASAGAQQTDADATNLSDVASFDADGVKSPKESVSKTTGNTQQGSELFNSGHLAGRQQADLNTADDMKALSESASKATGNIREGSELLDSSQLAGSQQADIAKTSAALNEQSGSTANMMADTNAAMLGAAETSTTLTGQSKNPGSRLPGNMQANTNAAKLSAAATLKGLNARSKAELLDKDMSVGKQQTDASAEVAAFVNRGRGNEKE